MIIGQLDVVVDTTQAQQSLAALKQNFNDVNAAAKQMGLSVEQMKPRLDPQIRADYEKFAELQKNVTQGAAQVSASMQRMSSSWSGSGGSWL